MYKRDPSKFQSKGDLERKVRDSCGKTCPRESPQAQGAEEASRTARGKRVPGVEINISILTLKNTVGKINDYRVCRKMGLFLKGKTKLIGA
ncbi:MULTISPECIES: hypothetical protein [Peribacillus]|uniref:Transposase n=1 Tax=Peribacillus castrilensis TaxID=2897690 RepID=A0AAW9NEH9_9BACI|nr:hypothetical protein [Peribacillus frigoritolerans]MEC0273535.1 hypothetical protein [Peribacillus castrilensis]MEC0343149.1 hypothetical protein [Peribacillus castrilensis]TFH61239.1 hypothetical protein E4J71_13065 [Peribacillus frigoritolerans]